MKSLQSLRKAAEIPPFMPTMKGKEKKEMNNRIKKSFAFLASAAMLVAGSIGSGLVTPVYANTDVSDSALVSKYPKHNVTKAELKKLQDQNWNVKSFSGKYRLKSVRKERVRDGMAFNVDFTSGKLSGIDQAIAYCRMHGAKDPGPGTAKYTAKVSKSGKKVRIILDMDPPQTPRANTKSGTGYQYLGLWLEFNAREEKGALRVSKVDSATGSLVTGSSATFEVRNSKNSVVATLKTGTAGTATTGKLPAGKYTVKEIGAPSGYSIDVTAGKTVTVSGDKTADVAFRDTKKLAAINIQKYFSNGSTGDTRVLGAQYTLYASSDIRNPENGSIAWKKGSVISGRDGIGDTGAKTISTPDGKLSWNRLPDGIYTVRETKAPKGAELDPDEHEFDISSGQIKGNSKIVKVNEETTPYHAYLLKKDENGSPLAGAKFEVKLEDDVKTQGWEKSHLYGTFVSGEDGKSNTIEIPYGRYLVKEVSAPEGYKVSKDEKPLVIDGSKETTEIEFTDEREEINLHTTATDGETETHSGVIGKKAVINDAVSYTNLIRGRKYRISGKLMDKETKQPLLVNGKEVNEKIPKLGGLIFPNSGGYYSSRFGSIE